MLQILFWLSLVLLLLGTVGYPMVLWLWVKIKKCRPVYLTQNYKPKVSVILPCYNEEKNIIRKITNLLQLEYDPQKLEIILISDGSVDKTNQLIQDLLPHPQLVFKPLMERQGKPNALNVGVAAASGQILVFSDSRQLFNPQCIQELVNHFGDEMVGGVSGNLIDYAQPEELAFEDLPPKSKLATLFREVENKMKYHESCLHSVVGVYGALYAIRKELYEPLPSTIILDDMLVPFAIIRKGYRILFASNATASEVTKDNIQVEVNRRKRIFIGIFQLLFEMPALLSFKNNPVLVQLILHKFLRLLVPFLLIILFVCSILLMKEFNFYQYIFWGQVFFYVFCAISLLFKAPATFYLFSKFNISVLQGLYDYVTKSYSVKWQKQT